MNFREIRLKQEEYLSPRAAKSTQSLGRMAEEPECAVRSLYERDGNRILYSEEFRRLRHKTQVFFNAKNDHICTRMEHVLYVNAISNTIGRTLGLNQDLITAIALGHDVGHAPFGHSGERALNRCLQEKNPNLSFHHEYHSLRVVDRLSTRISKEMINEQCGLNLSYEVRDGIVSHCGENYEEYVLQADKTKRPEDIYTCDHRHNMPYTLEACVVRIVDKIAYVGRDIEDAIRARLMDYSDISGEIRAELGATNGKMIDTLVQDLIENSYDTDYIRLSDARGEALRDMILTNNKYIYRAKMIGRYENNADNAIEGLFEAIYPIVCRLIGRSDSRFSGMRAALSEVTPEDKFESRLLKYMMEKNYDLKELPEQITADYIAGMTDGYALSVFEELYWI